MQCPCCSAGMGFAHWAMKRSLWVQVLGGDRFRRHRDSGDATLISITRNLGAAIPFILDFSDRHLFRQCFRRGHCDEDGPKRARKKLSKWCFSRDCMEKYVQIRRLRSSGTGDFAGPRLELGGRTGSSLSTLSIVDSRRREGEEETLGVPPSGRKDQSDPRKRGTPNGSIRPG